MAGDFEQDGLGNDSPITAGSTDANLIGDVGDASPGKHLVLFVPDFTNTREATPETDLAGQAPMNSYLRLGAADSRVLDATQVALGQDLALLVQGFTDDYRERGDINDTPPGSPAVAPDQATNAKTPGGAEFAPPTTTSTANDFPKAESLQLHTKGGWRDHSDGNRITTTRGDKVEIVRGNYKLLVLGRNDDIGNAVGFDMSGGIVDTDSGDLAHPTPQEAAAGAVAGLDVTWTWAQDSDGNFRWHVTTLQGNATVGTGGPGSVDGVSGTSTAPSMTTTTWAYDLTSTTNANTSTTTVTTAGDSTTTTTSTGGDVASTTTAAGNVTSSTSGFNVTNTTNAVESLTNGTNAQTISNTTTAGANLFNETAAPLQESLQQVALNLAFNLVAMQVAVDAGITLLYGQFGVSIVNEQAAAAIISAQQASAILNSTTAGACISNFAGIFVDNHLAIHVDNHSGVHVDNHAGVHVDLHEGVHISSKDVHTGTTTAAEVQTWLGARANLSAQMTHLVESTDYKMAGVTVTM